MTESGQQRLPDSGVMRGQRPEFTVISTQILQVGHQPVHVVDIGDNPNQRAHQPRVLTLRAGGSVTLVPLMEHKPEAAAKAHAGKGAKA